MTLTYIQGTASHYHLRLSQTTEFSFSPTSSLTHTVHASSPISYFWSSNSMKSVPCQFPISHLIAKVKLDIVPFTIIQFNQIPSNHVYFLCIHKKLPGQDNQQITNRHLDLYLWHAWGSGTLTHKTSLMWIILICQYDWDGGPWVREMLIGSIQSVH